MLLLLAASAHAHYKFPRLVVDGKPEAADWVSVRKTKVSNSRDNGAVSDVNSADMRCFGGSSGKATSAVAAGAELGFVVSSGIMHFGPCQFYMARVPDGKDIDTWDAAGSVWFKAGSISAVQTGGPLSGNEATWPAYHKTQVAFKIPAALPSGKYLVRVESIALHLAQNVGGAQFYISCGQVDVMGGGSGVPGPLVAFPGAYKASDPGLIWPNSPPRTSYTAPGPVVWEG
ncbi:glycoside hydrolase [Lasiosphaeria miniovina]|uniref:lytic cellulose monooxygenase (C4-dehydrogenating) n=1 Tax=Lasiosphaeria miniovina TaxID=1954250 RepID=A0AA39ZZ01_9PEZI|nr:glycoside hydrolase [Lasiosphaeria miniovina]KAK0706225.1 glycoside hydrolase [Lasiosphaeria miniovina]